LSGISLYSLRKKQKLLSFRGMPFAEESLCGFNLQKRKRGSSAKGLPRFTENVLRERDDRRKWGDFFRKLFKLWNGNGNQDPDPLRTRRSSTRGAREILNLTSLPMRIGLRL
jgi:hypothetical protein